jgi:hypothetical protein
MVYTSYPVTNKVFFCLNLEEDAAAAGKQQSALPCTVGRM